MTALQNNINITHNINKPIISHIGWYILSTNTTNNMIKSVIHDYKKYTTDVIVIHDEAYYFDTKFTTATTNFNVNTWKKVSILDNMIPHLGYWILVERYNRI
tara:strand:- start:8021 stop:8326 length:306 start_codon:yes stop_codon:yes gene_type:complete